MRAVNIMWDIDEVEGSLLPTEVEIPDEIITNSDEYEEEVGNWLSDTYGMCFQGFDIEE